MKLLHKKRGDRSSVPPLAGSLIEALGDAALTLLGSVALTAVVVDLVFRLTDGRPWPNAWRLAFFLLPALGCVSVGLFRLMSLVFRSSLTVERRCVWIGRGTLPDRTHPDRTGSHHGSSLAVDLRRPGKRLPYRLPLFDDQLRPLANLGGLGLVASVAAAALASTLWERRFSLSTTLLLVFALIFAGGVVIWCGWFFARRLVRWYRCGPTCVEVSDCPAQAGETLEIFLRQCDRARWRSVQLVLECHEEAVFHQGTDVRRESRCVVSLPCELAELPSTREGEHRDLKGTCTIPSQAMHTFTGSNNSIHWRLRVSARAKRGVVIEREAPLVLVPAATPPAPLFPVVRRPFPKVEQEVG